MDKYLTLVDWTGRAIRSDTRGFIDHRLPSIMQRLSIDADAWWLAVRPRGNVFTDLARRAGGSGFRYVRR
jgi:hypothetical protein